MAIKIVLTRKRGYFTQLEEIETRIDIALNALQYIMQGEVFAPSKIVAWENAPMVELGGSKVGEEALNIETIGAARDIIPSILRLASLLRQKSTTSYGHSVFRIEGLWNINGVRTGGFLSINNDPNWQTAYGDIDIDGYPMGKYEDFLDIFWDDANIRNEMIKSFFDNFVKDFSSKDRYQRLFEIQWICFATGVPSPYEMPDIKAAYYDGVRSFVDSMFLTFTERNRELVQKSLSRKYLVRSYLKSKKFQEQIQAMMIRSNVDREKGSLKLVGKEKDSFATLYGLFAKNYLDALYGKLKVDDQVKNTIEENIHRTNAFLTDNKTFDDIFDLKEENEDEDEE